MPPVSASFVSSFVITRLVLSLLARLLLLEKSLEFPPPLSPQAQSLPLPRPLWRLVASYPGLTGAPAL